jgi:hypothetical protein
MCDSQQCNMFRQNEQLHHVLVQWKKLTWSSNVTLTDQSISQSTAEYKGLDLAFCIWARKAEGGWAWFAWLVESYVWLSGLLATLGKPISFYDSITKLTPVCLLVCSGTVFGIKGSIWFSSSQMCTLGLSQSLIRSRHAPLSIFTLTAWLYGFKRNKHKINGYCKYQKKGGNL